MGKPSETDRRLQRRLGCLGCIRRLGRATNFKAGKNSLFFLKFLRAGNSKVDKAVTAMTELIITIGKLADSEQLPKYYQYYVQMQMRA